MYFPGAMTPVHRASAHREKTFDVPTLLDRASQEHNVPTLLTRAQARQESGFNPNAVSNKGATGVMQLMPRTAQDLGVDAHDTEQNIYGGVRLMSQLHSRFGHWDRALAAYNWGPDHVQQAIDKYGDHWLQHTPQETQGYVHKIMSEYGKSK
jgi:soluble lytic murein transglycosylase-like protein